MGIRLPAAEKLAKQLLELRPPRMEALEPRFFTAMAKVIMAYVDIDEQRQRTEKMMEETTINQCDGCRRGLYLRDNIHYVSFPNGDPVMACTKERYTAASHADQSQETK